MKRSECPRVALVLLGVAHLHGSGGAERHFSDLFEYLRDHDAPVSLISDAASIANLRSAGHLRRDDGVIALPLGPNPVRGRLQILKLTSHLMRRTINAPFDVVHICLPTPTYVPYAAMAGRLPPSMRPRVTLSVIDCTLAPNLSAEHIADPYERQVLDAHKMYARWARLDGIFTWYRAFAEASRRARLFPERTAIVPARYCFTDTTRFHPAPERDRLIVFAGRLSAQKRPLLFVDAVARLVADDPALVDGWRFEMYGLGPLEAEVRQRIAAHRLDEVLRLSHAPDLAGIFGRSRLFVSTQAIENFTSLAMLEAMAAGNAVIAEDVGQTAEYVRHEENGLLVQQGTPEQFAAAIARYLRETDRQEARSHASRSIAVRVHTIEHAAEDIISFWRTVAAAA